jgi:hypothetical protein
VSHERLKSHDQQQKQPIRVRLPVARQPSLKDIAFGILILVRMAIMPVCAESTNEIQLLKLADERFAHDISSTEQALFRAAADGEILYRATRTQIGDDPNNSASWPAVRAIRADRLAWLCGEPDASALVNYRGVRIIGLRIDGALHLESAHVPFPLSAVKCSFTDTLFLSYCNLRSLELDGSRLKAIAAQRCKVADDVSLATGFVTEGVVNLSGSSIGGYLICDGGHFDNPNGYALYASAAKFGFAVFLRNDFQAIGEVNFVGASIGGQLVCAGGRFMQSNPEGAALNVNAATIAGSVFLSSGFHATGEVNIEAAEILGDLRCLECELINTNSGGYALNARGAKINGSVRLIENFRAVGMVDLNASTIGGSLVCSSNHISNPRGLALNAIGAKIGGAVILGNDLRAEGEVNLVAANIGGDLHCLNFEFVNTNTNGCALNASRAKIDGGVALFNHFRAEGLINLADSIVGGTLSCTEGHVSNPIGLALTANAARIGSGVVLGDDFQATGEVNLVGAQIKGTLECQGGKFINTNSNGYALTANGAKIGGSVFLSDHFEATGEVNLVRATIGGNLECLGGRFVNTNTNGRAFSADRSKIEGDVFLEKGFRATGRVGLEAANIGGDLRCGNCQLVNSNANGLALDAKGAKIDGSVFLTDQFNAEGGVDLAASTIGGSLVCNDSHFFNPNGVALSANSAKIAGGVSLRDHFRAEGEVILFNANIGQVLDCNNGEFINANDFAIQAARITVKDISLAYHFYARGVVDFSGSIVHGNLDCRGGKFVYFGAKGPALDVTGAKIEGNLCFYDHFELTGSLDLRNATVEMFWDARENWPQTNNLSLDGFVYDKLGTFSLTDARSRIDWLRLQSQDHFLPQPYEQLAKVLRSMGHGEEADEVMIEKNRDHGRRLPWYSLSHLMWYATLGKIVGFGYKPLNALYWSLGFVFLGWFLFRLGYRGDLLEAKDEKAYGTKFHAFIYSVETFMPLVKLGVGEFWLPNASAGKRWIFGIKSGSWLRVYYWLHIMAGWFLTTLWVAGVAGLVKT